MFLQLGAEEKFELGVAALDAPARQHLRE